MSSRERDDEPTQVHRRAEPSPASITHEDLQLFVARVPRDEETESTPKVHDLAALLRSVQQERLRGVGRRSREDTLRSGPHDKEVLRISTREPLPPPVEPSKWRWVAATLALSALLLVSGAVAGRLTASPKDVHVTWDVAAPDATVTIGGSPQPLRGRKDFACVGSVSVVVDVPNGKGESLLLPCGAEAVLRLGE